MEGAAAGAQTGKAARRRGRRRPSKEDLVADALRAGLPPLEDVPDPGGVREDLLELCRRAREVMYSRLGIALRSVVHECDATQAQYFQEVILAGVVEPAVRLLDEPPPVVSGAARCGRRRPTPMPTTPFRP